MAEALVCPRCGTTYGLDERFCPSCGMPLVYAGTAGIDQPVTDTHARARKIKPQYSEGPLVHVAGASNQAEAEFIQGLLLEEGVPSMLRRTRGFDVPDMLAAGPRDVLVPRNGFDAAREVLLQAEVISDTPERPTSDRPIRVLVWLVAAVVVVALILWLGTELSA